MTAVTQQYMTDNSYRYFRIFMRESQGIYLGTEWWRKYYMALNELELISNNQNILRSSQYTSTITAGTTGSGSPNVSVIKDGDLSSDASRTGTIWHNHYSWDADEQNIWVQIELNLSVEIQKIRMYHHSFSEWEFLGSNDGVNWNRVYYKVEPTKGDYTFFKWNEYDLTVTSSGITKGVLTWDPSRNGYIGEFSIGENGCSEEFVYNLGSFEGNVNVEILDVDSQYANTSKTINVIDCTTYNLTASSSSVLEGGSVDITLETNAGVGEYPYTISGQGISTSDIAQGLSGKFTIDDSGKSVITLNISEDVEMESNETFTLQLSNGKSSVDVTITNIYYSLSASSTQVNEGETVTVTLNTNAPDGTCKYSIETLGSFDSNDFIENTPLNGFISFQNGSGQVSLTLKNDLITEGAESFIFKLVECGDEPSVTISVNDTSTEPITYSVAVDPPTVNEGGTVTATVTTNGPDGSCNYSLSGSTGFSVTDDLDGNVSSTGTVNIQNGTGTVTFTVKEDYTTEGQESFTFQLVGCGDDPSATVTVNDTSGDPEYNLSVNPTTINEGSSATVTLTTVNVPDGTCSYTITGVGGFNPSSDFSSQPLGYFNIVNGSASETFTVIEDNDTNTENQSFRLTLTGCGNGENVTVNIVDSSQTIITYSVTANPPTANEGDTVTVTVTTNAPDGSCNYSLSGSTGFSVANDFDGNVSSTGTVNIQNGTGTVSFTLKEDLITEGQESFTFQLVGCGDDPSATVTVNDTSTEPIDYSVTANPPTVNEGDTVTITVTTNAPDGSCNYSLSGSTGFSVTDDLDGNVSSTGTVNIQNGTGTVSFTVNEDYITEGQESFTFQLVGCGDNPSATVTVNDTSLTPTPNALLREGGQSPNTWYTGRSISISEDGMVLATTRGTSQSNNNIDIFDYVNGGWVFRSSVHDSNNRVEPLYVDGNDSFAHLGQYQGQLALSSDGKILVAGAHQWKDRSGNWNPDINGWSNIDEGAVFTYHWNENTTSWDYVCITRSSLALGLQANQPPLTDEGQIDPSILGLANLNFGRSVDISDDGTKMIVGCPGDVSVGTDLHDRVYTYNWNSSTQSWDEHSIIYNPRINNGTVEFGSDSSLYQDRSQFGEGVSISGNGQKIVIGAPNWGSESWRDFQIDSQYMYDRWGAGYTSQYGTVYYHKQRGSRGVVFSYTLSNNQWVLQQQQTHEWKLDPNYFTHFPAIYSRYDSIGYDATRWDSSGRVYGLSFGESLSLDYEGNNLIVGCERMLANILDGTSYSGTGGIFIFKRGSDGSWVHELPYDITNTGYDSNSGEMVGETYLTDGAHLNFYENPLNIKIHPPDYEMICTEYSCYDGEANRGTGNSSDFVVPPDDHRPWNYPWCAGTRGYGYDVSYSFSAKRLIVNTWQGDLMNPDSNSPCYDFSTPLIFTLHLNTEGSVIELNNTVEDYWNQDFYEWRDGQ